MSDPTSTTTYLIEKENGKRFKITVPSEWKVTFGPAARGLDGKKSGASYKIPLALRFYENETKQRAIFTDVVSFRDMSIPIAIEEEDIQEKHGYTEVDGKRHSTVFQAKVKRWANPDDLSEEKPFELIDKED